MEPVDPSTGTPTSAPEINPSERWALPRVLFWKVKSKVDFLVSSMHLEFPAVAPLISIDFLPGKKKQVYPMAFKRMVLSREKTKTSSVLFQQPHGAVPAPAGFNDWQPTSGNQGTQWATRCCCCTKQVQVSTSPEASTAVSIWHHATKHSCPIEITQKLRSRSSMATIYSLWN